MQSTVIYDLKEIAEQLYGTRIYRISDLPEKSAQADAFTVQKADAKKRNTFNGSPIWGSKDLIGREVFLPVTIEAGGVNYEFPFSILAMRRAKLSVETPMVERDGSVIEEIGLDNWKISMKGFLVDPLNQFPDEQLAMLDKVFKAKRNVRLKCALSDIFLAGDDHVFIKELDIPDKAKVEGVRDFAMTLISDTILTLEL